MSRLSGALAACVLAAAPLAAQRATLDSATLAGFAWRTVGPANFEGRVADIAGIPSPSQTFFVAAAGGGIWKTTNGGVTFRPVFDDQRVVAMGSLAIAPSDTQQVWAGTGEQNSRNTIEPGHGIFKSTDGGLTWHSMGLEKTQHIGRIVVHPTNPNIVYVAALGAAWTTNPERGLYKTEDGGKTWKLVKFVSDRAGFVDVALDPKDPNTVWASSYERMRGPYFLTSGGPGSGLWKSTDAGATWTEIRGGGFPETTKGRISLAIYPQDPNIVYTMVEADSVRGRTVKGAAKQKLGNGLYRTRDGGRTWEKMNDANTRPFYYSQVRVHPRNPDRVWFSSTPVLVSNDGGKTARTATQGIHVDHHAMWIDPNLPDHFIVGDDGGVSITWDGGGTYDFPANLPIGQFYDVSYDFETPYNVCAGAQDNGSWCGPSRRKSGPVTNAYWSTIAGGDGFYTAQHPQEPWIVFGESQGGNISRLNLRTGERASLVKPAWRPRYQQFEDSVLITRGDSTRPETREQRDRIAALRARQRADSAQLDIRFNWETPYFISNHNPDVMYVGGNRVLKSTRRGDSLYFISPDLSKQQRAKIDTSMNKTGGITLDATGAETYGTVVSLAESYVRPGFLYAGTDDGNIWTTTTDGASWEPIPATRFPGLPRGDVYVSRIEPSHFDSLTFYVSFDNHRWNDFTPYLYATTDGGRTFRSLAAGLPTGSADYVHVVREDPTTRDLLYVGTSVGAYVSLDRGTTWQRFMTGLPTVPVFDLKVHPRDRELIAATHGRGLWMVDVAPLQQMAGSTLATVASAPVHLFAPKTGYEYGQGPAAGESSNGSGHKLFAPPSPAYGAEIVYRVAPGTAPAAAVAARGGAAADSAGQSTIPASVTATVPDEQATAARAGTPPPPSATAANVVSSGGTAAGETAAGAGVGANGGRRRGGQGGGGGPRGPQASILITNARGDTVRTLTGPATAGLHRVTWDFRGRPAPRAPLSPSQRRDSVERAQRATFVIDSLEKAGAARPVIETLRRLTSGSIDAAALFRGGNRGAGGTGGAFVARPGEGAFVGAAGTRDQGEGTAAAGGEQSPMEALNAFPGGTDALTELFQIPGRPPERGNGGLAALFGGGGGRRGASAPVVPSGDYLVTLTVGGRTYKELLRVERLSGGDDSGSAFGGDDDDDRDP